MTRKDVKGDQPSGGETTWTNTGATRYSRGQHKTGSFGDDMLRPSPNHGTQRLRNDDDEYNYISYQNKKLYYIDENVTRMVVNKSTVRVILHDPFVKFNYVSLMH